MSEPKYQAEVRPAFNKILNCITRAFTQVGIDVKDAHEAINITDDLMRYYALAEELRGRFAPRLADDVRSVVDEMGVISGRLKGTIQR